MAEREIKAALFDLDGVIIDTEPSYGIFWASMGDKYEVGVESFADVIKGTTLSNILDTYFEKKLHDEIVDQLNEYERNMQYAVFPEAEPYLKKLRARGILTAIVTSSNLKKLANLWRQQPQLKSYFDIIVSDEDVTESKPSPQPYLIAAERLDVSPCDCAVYEDSENGLLSGRRSGAYVIALATTLAREMLQGKADMIIDRLSDIP